MKVISQMSMDDLYEMTDRELWARKLYRFEVVKRCLCGIKHVWSGFPFGGWTDQNGLIVMCKSPVNPKRQEPEVGA